MYSFFFIDCTGRVEVNTLPLNWEQVGQESQSWYMGLHEIDMLTPGIWVKTVLLLEV